MEEAGGEAGDVDRGVEVASEMSLGWDQRGSAGAADAGEDAGALDGGGDGDALAVVEEARGEEVAADGLGRASGAGVDGAVARLAEVGAAAVDGVTAEPPVGAEPRSGRKTRSWRSPPPWMAGKRARARAASTGPKITEA